MESILKFLSEDNFLTEEISENEISYTSRYDDDLSIVINQNSKFIRVYGTSWSFDFLYAVVKLGLTSDFMVDFFDASERVQNIIYQVESDLEN
jgi:hypothetical protein